MNDFYAIRYTKGVWMVMVKYSDRKEFIEENEFATLEGAMEYVEMVTGLPVTIPLEFITS